MRSFPRFTPEAAMSSRRFAFALFAMSFLVLPAPASAQRAVERVPGRPRLAPDSPKAAIRCLAQAYNERSIGRFEGLLSADYRFHFSAGDSAGSGYLNAFDRGHELRSARRLFTGVDENGEPAGIIAKTLRVTVGGMDEGADPEHPDSLSAYRVVVARQMTMRITREKGETMVGLPADQIFYLVRGDVAQRVEGQPGLATRWYIRRWMEDVRAVEKALAATDGHCEDAEKMAAGAALAGAFGVRALDSPLCPTLDVVCDLPTAEPATLEVYDLQGRRVARQELHPSAPGTVRVQAGSGQRFAPGAYWLRLTQGRRAPSKRMVIVAR
jgi:hypothetical protein